MVKCDNKILMLEMISNSGRACFLWAHSYWPSPYKSHFEYVFCTLYMPIVARLHWSSQPEVEAMDSIKRSSFYLLHCTPNSYCGCCTRWVHQTNSLKYRFWAYIASALLSNEIHDLFFSWSTCHILWNIELSTGTVCSVFVKCQFHRILLFWVTCELWATVWRWCVEYLQLQSW